MNVIELSPSAFLDLRRSLIKRLSMDMKTIRDRMEALEVDLATLNRRYCEIRQSKGDKKAVPVNRRNMLAKAISDEGNPTMETFIDIVTALDGRVLIEWTDKRVEKISSETGTYKAS